MASMISLASMASLASLARAIRAGARARACALIASFAGLVALAAFAGGCGHGATEADCEVIVDRNVELAMKKLAITDQAIIDKRKQEIRTELKDKLAGCVGKRITDSMLKCVKNAESPEAIDTCLK